MVFAYTQENLRQSFQGSQMIQILIQYATQEINRLVFFPFGNQYIQTPVNHFSGAVKIFHLQKFSPDFQQIVVTCAIQFNQT